MSSSPAVVGGRVYVGSLNHNVYALNSSTGTLIWTHATSQGVESSPAVADGRVFVGSDDYKVYAFGAAALSAAVSPSAANLGIGQSQKFTSSVSGGTSSYSYQWYVDGVPVSGATSPTWTFVLTSVGLYRVDVEVIDSVGMQATSNTAAVTVSTTGFSATISPSSVVLNLSQSQLFTSSVTGGTSPYSYQWYLNDLPVTGATNPTWTFRPTSAGSYRVYLKVTDSSSAVATSNAVRIEVHELGWLSEGGGGGRRCEWNAKSEVLCVSMTGKESTPYAMAATNKDKLLKALQWF